MKYRYCMIHTEEVKALYDRIDTAAMRRIHRIFNTPGTTIRNDRIEATKPRLYRIGHEFQKLMGEALKSGEHLTLKTIPVYLKGTEESVDIPLLIPYREGDEIRIWRVHKGFFTSLFAYQERREEDVKTEFMRLPNILL